MVTFRAICCIQGSSGVDGNAGDIHPAAYTNSRILQDLVCSPDRLLIDRRPQYERNLPEKILNRSVLQPLEVFLKQNFFFCGGAEFGLSINNFLVYVLGSKGKIRWARHLNVDSDDRYTENSTSDFPHGYVLIFSRAESTVS
jgi:hypothetical protein